MNAWAKEMGMGKDVFPPEPLKIEEPTEVEPEATIHAASTEQRSKNPLRPDTFAEVVGQEAAKKQLQRIVEVAKQREDRVIDHMLFVGASGTGKSTFSHVIANEIGVDVYEIEAPVSHDTLMELRTIMQWGDILRIEEIHQQAIMERRGRESSTQPEVLFSIMEDRVIQTATGVLPFPDITVIGTTTDEGMLPDPFINRFPIRPYLAPYTDADMKQIAVMNAEMLKVEMVDAAAEIFARASRGVPRQMNNYMKNADSLVPSGRISKELALEVLDLNGVTRDGLTRDMQEMLIFLYTRARHQRGDGEVKYQASVNTIATAIGKSRDTKAVSLRVEPFLIQKGYVQVGHGGRSLTADGVDKAQQLLRDRRNQ